MQARSPASPLRRPLLLALVGLSLVAVGLALQPLSPEGRFALHMIPHHAQAVELSRIVETRAQDENLRYLARDIVQTQDAQIAQMRGWLPWWRRPFASLGGPDDRQRAAMGMATETEVAELLSLQGTAAEARFLQLMIRHHQGALPMIEAALPGVQADLPGRLLRAMANSQTGEIATMRRWLADRGAQPLPPPSPGGHSH